MRNSTKLYLAVGAIVVAATVAVIARPSTPTPLAPGSPEAAVQTYVQAIIDDQPVKDLLTDDAIKFCENGGFTLDEIQRVRIEEVKTDQSRSVVEVEITWTNPDDPFGGEYSSRDRFVLVDGTGEWLIDEVPWSLCEER